MGLNVLGAIAVATLASGLLLLLIGLFRLAETLRFVPSAVTGGFFCATGLVVLTAGLKIATDRGIADLWGAIATDRAILERLLVAIGFFAAFHAARRLTRSPLLMPLGFIAASLAIFVASRTTGRFIDWYPADVGTMTPFQPLNPATLSAIDWRVVLAAAPEIAALCIVVVVTMVVRTSGFELGLKRRADFDAEFRGHGLANVIIALCGGTASAAAPGTTKLISDLGSVTRYSVLVVPVVVGLILLAGINLTTYVPLPILAGLLIIVGWSIAYAALAPPVRQRSWTELVVILLIVAVAMRVGFVSAILVGFAVSCFLFALSYSRIGVIRRHMTRATLASHVSRAPPIVVSPHRVLHFEC
jgi:SulP family sulfate permease